MADPLFGNRLSGIVDAIASSSETISVSVNLMLPFAAPMMGVAKTFVWWGILFAVAATIGKLLLQQASTQELSGKLGLAVVVFVCFIPIQVKPGPFGQLPLASYVTWKSMGMIDEAFREGVSAVVGAMTGNETSLPLNMIHTLNNEAISAIDGTPLAPIISDYVANCTYATTMKGPNGEQLTQNNWRSVGLLGSGGLGFEASDILEQKNEFKNGLMKIVSFGTVDLGKMEDVAADWESQRDVAKEILRTVEFPKNIGNGYELPTKAYWESKINQEAIPQEEMYVSMSLPDDAAFLSTHDYAEYRRTGAVDADTQRWNADNCYELYLLAHRGTRAYLTGLSDHYQVSMTSPAKQYFPQEAKAAGGAALGEAMRTYYTKTANREAGGGEGGQPVIGSFVSKESDSSPSGWSSLMGGIHELSAILLKINLDQLIMASLGTLSLGIAFLAIIFPIFVMLSPIVGGHAITLPLKTMIMLELTLMMSYAIASVGLELLAALNVVAVNSAAGAFGIGSGTANLTVAVMTGMFLFPFFAAKLAHVIVFGSAGVGIADGRTISVGQQAGLAAAAAGAALALVSAPARLSSLTRAVRSSTSNNGGGGGSNGSGPSGSGGPRLPSSGAPRLGHSSRALPSSSSGRLALPKKR